MLKSAVVAGYPDLRNVLYSASRRFVLRIYKGYGCILVGRQKRAKKDALDGLGVWRGCARRSQVEDLVLGIWLASIWLY